MLKNKQTNKKNFNLHFLVHRRVLCQIVVIAFIAKPEKVVSCAGLNVFPKKKSVDATEVEARLLTETESSKQITR